MARIIALLVLVIPGFIAGYGIKLMRDMLFGYTNLFFTEELLWLQFVVGFILMAIGVGFIGGFILHRDRKRNKVQSRFKIPVEESQNSDS